MRPAQLTPENVHGAERCPLLRRHFNEAGAINAGKPADRGIEAAEADATSMRPAQLTPENGRLGRRESGRPRTSMRPAQLTPENLLGFVQPRGKSQTSMRPAQLTPENPARLRD